MHPQPFALHAGKISSIRPIDPIDEIKVAVFSPDSKLLAIGAETNSVRLFNVADGKQIRLLGESGEYWVSFVTALAFDAGGNLMASNGWLYDKFTGEINIWDIQSGKLVQRIPNVKKVTSLALSPDGKLVAAGLEHKIQVWEVRNGTPVWSDPLPETEQGGIHPLFFNTDGTLLISGRQHYPRSFDIYQISTGKRLRSLPGWWITAAKNNRLVTYSESGQTTTRRVWGAGDGKLLEQRQVSGLPMDDGLLEGVMVTLESGVGLRDAQTGRMMLVLDGHFNPFALSSDGTRLLFYSSDGPAIWSLPAISNQ
jgi:WD40 repeat protein